MAASVPEPASARRAPAQQVLDAAQIPDALLRLPTVQHLTGLGKTTIYALVARNEFPQPIRRGRRCTRWRAAEVTAWLCAQAVRSTP